MRRVGIDLIWEDTIKNVARPTPEPIQIIIDDDVMPSLKRVSRENVKVEADLFLAPAKIGKRGERPMTMYLLMIADSQSGFIFGLEAMSAEDSLSGMYGRFPEALARLLLHITGIYVGALYSKETRRLLSTITATCRRFGPRRLDAATSTSIQFARRIRQVAADQSADKASPRS